MRKPRITHIEVEESPLRSLVYGVLRKGNTWVWWWPDGLKMSGFVGDVRLGRLAVVHATL